MKIRWETGYWGSYKVSPWGMYQLHRAKSYWICKLKHSITSCLFPDCENCTIIVRVGTQLGSDSCLEVSNKEVMVNYWETQRLVLEAPHKKQGQTWQVQDGCTSDRKPMTQLGTKRGKPCFLNQVINMPPT